MQQTYTSVSASKCSKLDARIERSARGGVVQVHGQAFCARRGVHPSCVFGALAPTFSRVEGLGGDDIPPKECEVFTLWRGAPKPESGLGRGFVYKDKGGP